jgi:hypothetical protein
VVLTEAGLTNIVALIEQDGRSASASWRAGGGCDRGHHSDLPEHDDPRRQPVDEPAFSITRV